MPTVLITGANRGIGLELARQYAADGWRVLATCRDPDRAADLAGIGGNVETHRLDVDDASSVDALAVDLKGQSIDVLFNNAGVIGKRGASIADVDYDVWARTMATNLFGPVRVAWALRDNVQASTLKVMAFTGSKMGSIGQNTGGNVIYRSSKTALNMAVSCLAQELESKGVTAVVFHPGHVRTDMGGPTAPVTAPESVAGMRKVVAGLVPGDNGTFWNYDGAPLPW
ncbi:SDR family oxidoreductase [Thalassobaculum sp.]|uniref:SDR family oxidoreductase n=1 Tax=Thalassobaculum sp. TaxID=2022740 RepID=UPI0032ED1DCA